MGDWPKVVKTAIRSMKSDATSAVFLNGVTVDDRLSACYQEICHASGNLHRSKIIQNFAAAAFHLCYLLRVRVLLPIFLVANIFMIRVIFTCRKTRANSRGNFKGEGLLP